jgi:hypothetical protein
MYLFFVWRLDLMTLMGTNPLLVSISGPQKVPIFRAHPSYWPSKWICPHQNHYCSSRVIETTGSLKVNLKNSLPMRTLIQTSYRKIELVMIIQMIGWCSLCWPSMIMMPSPCLPLWTRSSRRVMKRWNSSLSKICNDQHDKYQRKMFLMSDTENCKISQISPFCPNFVSNVVYFCR